MLLEISYIRFIALFCSFLTVSLTTFRALNTKFNEQNTNSGFNSDTLLRPKYLKAETILNIFCGVRMDLYACHQNK